MFAIQLVHQLQWTNLDVNEWTKRNDYIVFLNKELTKIIKKYENCKSKKLGEIAKVQRGTLAPQKDEIISNGVLASEKNLIPWFTGQIYRYVIKRGTECWVDYNKLRENKARELFSCTKILGRQLISRQFRLQFAYVDEVFAFKKNLYAIYNLDKNIHYFYLLTLLNSNFYSYVQINLNSSSQRDDYPAFSLKDYRSFEIPTIRYEEQNIFVNLAKKILAITKDEDYLQNPQKQSQVKALEQEIDQMVYQLYGLTEEEIRIVEKS